MSIIDSARNRYYLNALGIAPLRGRDSLAIVEPGDEAPASRNTITSADNEQQLAALTDTPVERRSDSVQRANPDQVRQAMQRLAAEVASCQLCDLCQNRKQSVFGVGNPLADWMIIGEAPGAEEDRLGQPFVGRAGKLLDKMLLAIDLDRERAYIANVIKCRPSNNRDPRAEEIQQCLPYLQQQIALIRPKMILIVGRIAAQTLLESQQAIGRLRGQVYRYHPYDIPMVVTYHPAYLLRSPSEKQKSWQDLLLARAHYQTN